MRRFWFGLAGAMALAGFGAPALAQDFTGQWQGTVPSGPNHLRLILQVAADAAGAPACVAYILEETADQNRCVGAAINGRDLALQLETGPKIKASLSADGRTLTGTYGSGPVTLTRASGAEAWVVDPAPHQTRLVETSDHVKIEVLDYGGDGSPIVFLAGLGYGGHVFDRFALALKGKHHVYAISRRGYGGSDRPDPRLYSYGADRLAADVLDVIAALKLDRPALAGWSIGGSEISTILEQAPDKVRAGVYLDAAYPYAFYAPGEQMAAGRGSGLTIAANELQRKIAAATADATTPTDAQALIDTILKTDLPQLQADLGAARTLLTRMPPRPPEPAAALEIPRRRYGDAVLAGVRRHTSLSGPILAIFAIDSPLPPGAPEGARKAAAVSESIKGEHIAAFRKANPTAKVIEIKGAQHAVFASHPREVIEAIEVFLASI